MSDVRVGMVVKTVSGINKGELHDKKAEITMVNPASVWVRLLEGPLAGTENDEMKRTYKQIRPFTEDRPAPSTVPPAGQKRAADASGDAAEAAAKKAKAAERAKEIFGKRPVGTDND